MYNFSIMQKHGLVFALAVLLCSNGCHKAPNPTGDAENRQSPSQTISNVVPQDSGGKAFKDDASKKDPHQQPKPINITSGPPRDIYDYIAIAASLLLVGVGIWGIIVAVCTLRWIKHQSHSARLSAKAGHRQANHLVASERAWLTVEVLNFEEPPPKSNMIWIEVAITNRGKTPARVQSIVATSKFVPTPNSIADATPGKLPPYPDYDDTERVTELRGYDLVIAPEDTFRHIHVYIWPGELVQIKARKHSLYVYGTIEYFDTVKGDSHTTSFCSMYAVPLPNFGEPTGFMFSQYIPATYFRAT